MPDFHAAEVLASFINANKRIKGIQIGDHEIKIVSFGDNITIFLKDITCLCLCCPHIETTQLIYTTNKLTGLYMRAVLALNGLIGYK